MATRYYVEEILGFYVEYFQGVKSTRRIVWDDKKEPTMHDELLDGVGEYFQGVKSTRRIVWNDKEEPAMYDELLEGVGALVK
jgi:hypothetical protein